MHPTHTPPDVAKPDGALPDGALPDAVEPTPADILRYAALYLQRHGWHQGDMYADPDQPTPAACAQGAIRIAVCGNATDDYTPETSVQVDRAIALLAGHLHDTGCVDVDDFYGVVTASEPEIVTDWNDDASRTATDVILTLTEAADSWDTRHRPRHCGGDA